jgi:hypothetical protein
MTAAEAPWWTDSAEIARLYEWLCDRGDLDPSDVRAVAYFLARVTKWSAEYKAMCAAYDAAIEPLLEASLVLVRAGVRRFQ